MYKTLNFILYSSLFYMQKGIKFQNFSTCHIGINTVKVSRTGSHNIFRYITYYYWKYLEMYFQKSYTFWTLKKKTIKKCLWIRSVCVSTLPSVLALVQVNILCISWNWYRLLLFVKECYILKMVHIIHKWYILFMFQLHSLEVLLICVIARRLHSKKTV